MYKRKCTKCFNPSNSNHKICMIFVPLPAYLSLSPLLYISLVVCVCASVCVGGAWGEPQRSDQPPSLTPLLSTSSTSLSLLLSMKQLSTLHSLILIFVQPSRAACFLISSDEPTESALDGTGCRPPVVTVSVMFIAVMI